MSNIIFEKHTNFSLNPLAWGQGLPQDITILLDSVITEFYYNLDLTTIPNTPVVVCSHLLKDPPSVSPEIIKNNDSTIIFLCTKDLLWSQYSYQFSHELCHFVIDTSYPPANDKFGWFEESLCELASIYTLLKMASTWQTNPPYQHWANYSNALDIYAKDIVEKPENRLTEPLMVWLSENLHSLSLDRYKRVENQIVAVHLLPLFIKTPSLWRTIQFLNLIQVTDDMTFESYLNEWKKKNPKNLHAQFDNIITLLTGNTSKSAGLHANTK